jgi:hypothetical protein
VASVTERLTTTQPRKYSPRSQLRSAARPEVVAAVEERCGTVAAVELDRLRAADDVVLVVQNRDD